MRNLILATALFLSSFAVNMAFAQACEMWTEVRDGKTYICQRCGTSTYCS